jgi:hypothetical protein
MPVISFSLYLMFPACAPEEGSSVLTALQDELSTIKAGEGRSLSMQAAYQAIALGITLVVAIVTGCITGKESIIGPHNRH